MKRVEFVRSKLYKTALTYLGSESLALDAVDEAVYKALCGNDYYDSYRKAYEELERREKEKK